MCGAPTATAGKAAGKGQHGVFRCQGSAVAVTYRVLMAGKSPLQLASRRGGCHISLVMWEPRGTPEGVEYGRNIITMGFIQ